VKGTRPGHLPPPSKQEEGGRICIYPDCQTQLSIYNSGQRCWQHAEITFPNYRGKRLAPNKA